MKRPLLLLTLLAFAVLVALSTPWVGMSEVPWATLLRPAAGDTAATIFWKMRVPRVLAAYLAGAGLALSGLAFQAMFRNPLATPFTLGVSGGASVGAVLAIRFGIAFSFLGLSGTALCAFLGALAAIGLVYGITQMKGDFSTFRLLLAGVAINAFFSSLILFISYTAHTYDAFRLMRWLMGSLSISGYSSAIHMAPFVVVGTAILLLHMHELDLLNTGEDLAQSRGVNVKRTRLVLFFVTSLIVGSVVSVCGPIGFVGLIVPHICRLLIGQNHRYLMPATLLFGGAFLALCDTLARTAAFPAEIPVGVITALLGGPFFLWLLLGASSRHLSM